MLSSSISSTVASSHSGSAGEHMAIFVLYSYKAVYKSTIGLPI